jgi:hypothetical protein
MRGITDDERQILAHIRRWGSDGYPVKKLSTGKWVWGPWGSVNGPPICFRTKREAVASFEAFYDVLLDARAGRL